MLETLKNWLSLPLLNRSLVLCPWLLCYNKESHFFFFNQEKKYLLSKAILIMSMLLPPLYLNSFNFLSHTCDFTCHSVGWMVKRLDSLSVMQLKNTLKGNLTCITAPALPYGTDAVVYTALFSLSKSLNTAVNKKGEIVQ